MEWLKVETKLDRRCKSRHAIEGANVAWQRNLHGMGRKKKKRGGGEDISVQ